VDLTWRLKQLNRLYGTRAIVTAPVHREVADAFWFRRLDLLPIHDGTEHLELFELQGERSRALPVEDELFARAYEEGLEALLAGDWDGAERAFAALFEERPDDPSLHLMRRRCAARSILPCLAGTDLDQIADLAGAA
jgi:predicted Zn-dependent protease